MPNRCACWELTREGRGCINAPAVHDRTLANSMLQPRPMACTVPAAAHTRLSCWHRPSGPAVHTPAAMQTSQTGPSQGLVYDRPAYDRQLRTVSVDGICCRRCVVCNAQARTAASRRVHMLSTHQLFASTTILHSFSCLTLLRGRLTITPAQ
jgi:hypothetical protein